MKKFKEKRMASYVLRSNELIQEGKTKEAAELFGKGLGYYSSNIIHAITPYATADAGLISSLSTYYRIIDSELYNFEDGYMQLNADIDAKTIDLEKYISKQKKGIAEMCHVPAENVVSISRMEYETYTDE